MLRRKPLNFDTKQGNEHTLIRHYDFCSLLAIAVGGTIGSGILVLSGQIAVIFSLKFLIFRVNFQVLKHV